VDGLGHGQIGYTWSTPHLLVEVLTPVSPLKPLDLDQSNLQSSP